MANSNDIQSLNRLYRESVNLGIGPQGIQGDVETIIRQEEESVRSKLEVKSCLLRIIGKAQEVMNDFESGEVEISNESIAQLYEIKAQLSSILGPDNDFDIEAADDSISLPGEDESFDDDFDDFNEEESGFGGCGCGHVGCRCGHAGIKCGHAGCGGYDGYDGYEEDECGSCSDDIEAFFPKRNQSVN
jgi:hypothetical protein